MQQENNIKIMVLDDEKSILFSIKENLENFDIETFYDTDTALKAAESGEFQIIVIDYKMPKMNGLEFLQECRSKAVSLYTILLSAYAEKDILEESINRSLVNKVLSKPLKLNLLETALKNAVSYCIKENKDKQEIAFLKASYQEMKNECCLPYDTIIGINKGLAKVQEKIESVARHQVNVLLNGETGTGKELVAHAIHKLSNNNQGAFIKINCAAIPDTLIESELFGYSKGAFTDARQEKAGKIELANNGTLFLDEIGEMRLDLQTKLLRVLQEKELVRLGSNNSIHVDFRLITATNRDLQEQIKNKEFREDLYYRINTFPIILPALRDRRCDVEDLLLYFLHKFSMEMNLKVPDIGPGVITKLKEYSWPGNIREMENAVKRVMIILSEGEVLMAEHFNFLISDAGEKSYREALYTIRNAIINKEVSMQNVEINLLETILDSFGNNIGLAVDQSGISKNQFYRKLKNKSNHTVH